MSKKSLKIIKLRGLPWSVTPTQVLKFLDGVNVEGDEDGIYLLTFSSMPERSNGEAYVICADQESYNRAFELDKKTIGHRYIEVFSADQRDYNDILFKQKVITKQTVVKLRGLPWSATESEIADFFSGLELSTDHGIHIHIDKLGRASGEAFVQFANMDDYEKALKRHMEKIGERYIEIFRSSLYEMNQSINGLYDGKSSRRTPYDRNDGEVDKRGRSRNGRDYIDPWSNNPFQSNSGNQNMGNNFGGNDRNFYNDYNNDYNNDYYSNRNNFMSNNNNNNNNNEFRYGSGGNNFGGNNSGSYGNNSYNNSSDGSSVFNSNFGGNNNSGQGMNNFSGNRGGGGNDDDCFNKTYRLHLRGLPYSSTEIDIQEFFSPVRPVFCRILYNSKGLPSGSAIVDFLSRSDLLEAMKKDKEKIGTRYIELLYSSNKRFQFY